MFEIIKHPPPKKKHAILHKEAEFENLIFKKN